MLGVDGLSIRCNISSMHISAKIIQGLQYKPYLTSKLKVIDLEDFNINESPTSCIVKDGNFSCGVSRWVSPKRTRSYPYARVYDTLDSSKRITVIPIIKDEGKRGDRDFIQWDTVSLMSLFDVFVIFTYYQTAEKHSTRPNKITKQRYDDALVHRKFQEVRNYRSSALHWNLKELGDKSLPNLVEKVRLAYGEMSQQLGVEFHSEKGIDRFLGQLNKGIGAFMSSSRQKAKDAQNRESQTIQPKEALSTRTKATITIENYLGGTYYFTTDEIEVEGRNVQLIESKHSRRSRLPSIGDIKDGLIKMILYTNLEQVKIDGVAYQPVPIVRLTSTVIEGSISTKSDKSEIENFIVSNAFSDREKILLEHLLVEAHHNRFQLIVERAE